MLLNADSFLIMTIRSFQETYDIAMTSFLAGGGDGYHFLKDEIIEHTVAGNLIILLGIFYGN